MGWRTGATHRYTSGAKLPPDIKKVRDQGIPGHFLGGTRVKGHKWSTEDEVWTRKEMADEFASAVHARSPAARMQDPGQYPRLGAGQAGDG